jgi:hypothetical protein
MARASRYAKLGAIPGRRPSGEAYSLDPRLVGRVELRVRRARGPGGRAGHGRAGLPPRAVVCETSRSRRGARSSATTSSLLVLQALRAYDRTVKARDDDGQVWQGSLLLESHRGPGLRRRACSDCAASAPVRRGRVWFSRQNDRRWRRHLPADAANGLSKCSTGFGKLACARSTFFFVTTWTGPSMSAGMDLPRTAAMHASIPSWPIE